MSINLKIDTLQIDLILASVHKFSPGGDPIIVIADEDASSEVVLTETEAREVHGWLGRVLGEGA